MFGYIVVDKNELKIKEYDTYKAVYCSLCRRMGKDYGFLSKFTLSYDFTFAALLFLSLKSECCEFEKKMCRVNPLKKCVYCKNDVDGFDKVAAMAVLLSEYKLRDNIADSEFFKSVCYRSIHFIVKSWKKKATKKFPSYLSLVTEYEKGQSEVEKQDLKDIDKAAEPTANLLKSFFLDLTDNNKAVGYMAYCLGKWIYLLDAADDITDDLKSGNYNPLLLENIDVKEVIETKAKPNLNVCRVEAQKGFELIETKDLRSIIENILYLGLEKKQETVLGDKANEKSL